MKFNIREIKENEYSLLNEFLYEANFIINRARYFRR